MSYSKRKTSKTSRVTYLCGLSWEDIKPDEMEDENVIEEENEIKGESVDEIEEEIIDQDKTVEEEDGVEDIESDTVNEEEIEDDPPAEDEGQSTYDPHSVHFEYSLPEDIPKKQLQHQMKNIEIPGIGNAVYAKPERILTDDPSFKHTNISEFHLKKNLLSSVQAFPKELSPLQISFLNLISEYYDVSYMQRTPASGRAFREMYVLHILNHILKTRAKIIHHNSKLSKNPDEEYRDQGFVRPTALILVPFRHDVYCLVQLLSKFLPGSVTMNKKRFVKEYGPPPKEVHKKKKPADYEEIFSGNTDEDFKIGLSIKNKTNTLYSEFYSSDLIIASPLGLRQTIGAEGEKDRDFDFLSSIEILVMDRVDVMYMQNMPHLLHVLKHLNVLPKKTHGCNFFRVRMYALDEMSKFYRQTITLSAIENSWFERIFPQQFCFNYKGYVKTISTVKTRGIAQIFDDVKVFFRTFDFKDAKEECDDRFNFFINKVLPEFKEPEMAQTLLYIPSYYDFVRLRNYFRSNEISACMVCEYTEPGKVAEARNNFFKGRRHFMLYTERTHFYHRYKIKGIQHIIFYQPPTYPQFFREINFAFLDSNPKRKYEQKTCTVIMSKMDTFQVKPIVGMYEAKKMLNSEEKVFVKHIKG